MCRTCSRNVAFNAVHLTPAFELQHISHAKMTACWLWLNVQQVLKSVVAKFNASQLITQRQQVSLLIRKELTDRARDFNIILDDVALTELTFGKEYTAAVEAKQVQSRLTLSSLLSYIC